MICIRGAVTAENTREDILSKTKEMLESIIDKNNLSVENILSIFFTATKDLTAVYPAVAAREINITKAALMCFQEMHVDGSLEKCIRVTLTAESDKKQSEAVHVYMGGAVVLRPDLNSKQ